jgi:hypothetical protein
LPATFRDGGFVVKLRFAGGRHDYSECQYRCTSVAAYQRWGRAADR